MRDCRKKASNFSLWILVSGRNGQINFQSQRCTPPSQICRVLGNCEESIATLVHEKGRR